MSDTLRHHRSVPRLRLPLIAVTLVLLLLLDQVLIVQGMAPHGTVHAGSPNLKLELGNATRGATRVPLVARLVDESGAPIPAARITFSVDGTRDGEARTDKTGTATWRIRRDLVPGAYQVEAVWDQAPAARGTLRIVVVAPSIDLQLSSEPRQIGQRVTLKARLALPGGQPLADALVGFEVDGQREAAVRTDANGEAEWLVRASLGGGNHAIKAVFDGQPPLLPAVSEHDFTLSPGELKLHTVPASPGARFSLDGREFVAGNDGVAGITVDHAGAYSLTVSSGEETAAGVRREFATWGDGNTQATRSIEIPPGGDLDVGFNVFYLVTPRFTWAEGLPVEPQRISSLTLASSVGRKVTVNPLQPLWLQGSYILASPQQLESRPVSYGVDTVLVDASNVVNQSQHRFQPAPGQTLDVELFLFTAHFTARDALFGFPISSAIALTYPDGRTEEHELDSDGQVTVSGLARGLYKVKAKGSGLAMAQPMALSREQDIPVKLISTLDMGVLLGSLVLLALGLLLLGRRSSILAWVGSAGGAVPAAPVSFKPAPAAEPIPVEPEEFSTLMFSED